MIKLLLIETFLLLILILCAIEANPTHIRQAYGEMCGCVILEPLHPQIHNIHSLKIIWADTGFNEKYPWELHINDHR